MATVHRNNEVSLFGTFYPTIGPVYPMIASQFAPKQVIGDYTKESEQFTSSWVVSDQRGGIGIKDMDEEKDSNRCFFSTCELGYIGHLVLPALATDCGNPTASSPAVIIEYSNEEYVAFGTDVRKWVEVTASFESNLATLTATPTDAIVHKGKLYFACGTDFDRFDGTTWTTGTALAGSAQAARYFVEWDSKLFKIDNDGQLSYSIDEGVTWNNNALSVLPSGNFTSLFLSLNIAGEMVIHLGTKEGVFGLDFDNAKWVSVLPRPYHEYGSRGATWWRDPAYISAGISIERYAVPTEISLMGPDRDYGLPSDYRGSVIKLLAGYNALFAIIDASEPVERDLYLAGDDEYGNIVFYDNEGYSAILRWDTHGWGVMYLSGAAATPAKWASISSADDNYRLWFSVDDKVFYIPLQVTIQNPLEVADYPFASSAEHITPWFDANNSVASKLASKLTYYATDLSSTEYIKVYYALDYDDSTWTLLTNSDFPDGQVDADGEAEFTFASQAGVSFKAIRFKEELYRGSTITLSPDRRWFRLTYIKLLDLKWGFTVRLDVSRNYRFKRASSLLNSLKTALESQTLGAFSFKNGRGNETHMVRIANMKGAEVGGEKSRGVYEVTLIAP